AAGRAFPMTAPPSAPRSSVSAATRAPRAVPSTRPVSSTGPASVTATGPAARAAPATTGTPGTSRARAPCASRSTARRTTGGGALWGERRPRGGSAGSAQAPVAKARTSARTACSGRARGDIAGGQRRRRLRIEEVVHGPGGLAEALLVLRGVREALDVARRRLHEQAEVDVAQVILDE